MKFYREQFAILVISDRLVTVLSALTGFNSKTAKKPAMGVAVFPCFIILRNLTHPKTKEWLVHEKIHIIQFWESLGLYYFLSQLEYLYARIFLCQSHTEAYFNEAVEQESYLNQHDDAYLTHREFGATLKYFKNKKEIMTDAEYNVVIKD